MMHQTTIFQRLACLLLLVGLLSACQSSSEPTPTPEPAARVTQAVTNINLIGSSWQAESFGGSDDSVMIIPDTRVTVNFGVDRYAGSGGCNWFLGVYGVEGETLRFQTPAASRTQCATPPGIMEQEATYLSALLNIIAYRMEGEKLLGYTTDEQLLLTFVPAEPVEFEATTWDLKFIIKDTIAAPLIPETEITAQFIEGRLTGSSGCNTFEANYTLTDQDFALSDLTSTTTECAEPEGVQDQELLFLSYLQLARKLVHVGGIVLLQDELGTTLLAFGLPEQAQ
jgi:heat shock protein HslJ